VSSYISNVEAFDIEGLLAYFLGEAELEHGFTYVLFLEFWQLSNCL
jgi:hypothetical protein